MMKNITFIVGLALLTSANTAVALEPLSCRMQVMLHMMSAMRRDQGATKQDSIKTLKTGGELTSSEIREITNNVYDKYKNRTSEEIGNIIASKCK
jgi:hypothetical protein